MSDPSPATAQRDRSSQSDHARNAVAEVPADVSVGVLEFDGVAPPLVLALDALDDAMRHLDQELRGQLGVSNIDVLALQFIDRRQRRGDTTRARDLVPRLGVSSGAATGIVHRLEQAQLVESAADPRDGRGRTLILAVRAHELTKELLGPLRTDLRILMDALEPDQEAQLITLLDQVRNVLLQANKPTIEGAA